MTQSGWHRCPGRCGVTLPGHRHTCPTCWARVPNQLRLPVEHGSASRQPGREAADRLARAREDARDWLLDHPAPANPDASISGWCEHCDAQLLWLTTTAGKRMPVDAAPDPERGNVTRSQGVAGVLGDQAATAARAAGQPLWLPHMASCPHVERWHSRERRTTRKARR